VLPANRCKKRQSISSAATSIPPEPAQKTPCRGKHQASQKTPLPSQKTDTVAVAKNTVVVAKNSVYRCRVTFQPQQKRRRQPAQKTLSHATVAKHRSRAKNTQPPWTVSKVVFKNDFLGLGEGGTCSKWEKAIPV
jgi:hypothetical protein